MVDDVKIDAEMMGRLATALSFICGADHAATKALRLASESKSEKDAKAARAQFLKLKSSDRNAALTMLKD
ncbi:MAG: hypothetical protein ACT4OU_09265 [Hyphomicrobium sp.]